MSMLLVGIVAAVMLQCAIAQTVHVVGDNIGWTIPSNGAEGYISWASSKTFVIGDTLSKFLLLYCFGDPIYLNTMLGIDIKLDNRLIFI